MTGDTTPEPAGPHGSKTSIAGVFDRASASYDDTGVEFFSLWGRRLVEVAGLRAGDRVLDVGCGTGAALVPAADAVGPTGSVLGVDLAEGMVRRCLAACVERELTWASARVGDAEDPRVDPASVDVVLASLVMFFLPDPVRALRSYRTALVPGGTLALSTFDGEDARFTPVLAAIGAHVPRAEAGTDEPDTGGPSRRNPGPFGSDAGIEQILTANGFTEVAHVHEHRDVAFGDAGQWIEWSWSHGARALWESVPEAERDAARADAVAVLDELAGADGSISQRWSLRYSTARRAA